MTVRIFYEEKCIFNCCFLNFFKTLTAAVLLQSKLYIFFVYTYRYVSMNVS